MLTGLLPASYCLSPLVRAGICSNASPEYIRFYRRHQPGVITAAIHSDYCYMLTGTPLASGYTSPGHQPCVLYRFSRQFAKQEREQTFVRILRFWSWMLTILILERQLRKTLIALVWRHIPIVNCLQHILNSNCVTDWNNLLLSHFDAGQQLARSRSGDWVVVAGGLRTWGAWCRLLLVNIKLLLSCWFVHCGYFIMPILQSINIIKL